MTNEEQITEHRNTLEAIANSLSEVRDPATKAQLYREALTARAALDALSHVWADAPDVNPWYGMPQPPYTSELAPLKWFKAALAQVNKRNARRSFIKARYAQSQGAERTRLHHEAHQLGPYEPCERGDRLASEYLKNLAFSMQDHARSRAYQDAVCLECDTLVAPGRLFCFAHGDADNEEARESRNVEDMTSHADASGAGFDSDYENVAEAAERQAEWDALEEIAQA